jgi:hypothetical protein
MIYLLPNANIICHVQNRLHMLCAQFYTTCTCIIYKQIFTLTTFVEIMESNYKSTIQIDYNDSTQPYEKLLIQPRECGVSYETDNKQKLRRHYSVLVVPIREKVHHMLFVSNINLKCTACVEGEHAFEKVSVAQI